MPLGIGGVLTIVFVVLKLTNLIDWSWIWVLSPVWIPIVILIILGIISFGIEKYEERN